MYTKKTNLPTEKSSFSSRNSALTFKNKRISSALQLVLRRRFNQLINGSDFPPENINTEFELESSDEDDNCENDSSDDQTVVSDQFSFNSESESEVADEQQSSTNESE